MKRVNLIFANEEYQHFLKELCFVERNRIFCRHTTEHFFDTARIMYIISLEEKLQISKDIIYAAALLHDIGRVMQYKSQIPHDEASADFATRLLPKCGFSEIETQQIVKAILTHRRYEHDTENVLGELLYRADKLSRLCFCCNASGECYWDKNRKNSEIIY